MSASGEKFVSSFLFHSCTKSLNVIPEELTLLQACYLHKPRFCQVNSRSSSAIIQMGAVPERTCTVVTVRDVSTRGYPDRSVLP